MKDLTPEQRMVADIFAKNFRGERSRALVLYGLGRNTEGILQLCPDVEIAGVMGPDADSPVWNGRPVLSDEDVAALDADIVIIARDAVVPLIYRRIAALEQQGVQIFRFNGTKLGGGVPRWRGESLPCWRLTREDVMRRIDCAEYVSFDIFDTLLGRRFLRPEDLHAEAERQFPKRAWPEGAYAQARREAERSLGATAGIDAIYQCVQKKLGISPATAAELMELEWELERQNVYLRRDMEPLFRYVEERAKQIALISDMFWPADRLRSLLAEKGLRTDVPIFVSCEAGCSKEDGGLYLAYLEQTGAAPGNCLHIGDNRYADIDAARRVGLSVCQVLSALQMLEASAAQTLLDHTKTIQDRNTVGKWTAERCASPFALHKDKGRISVETHYELGYDFLGPLVDFWLDWLRKELRNQNLSRMLFPSRDGFLLHRLYKMMCEAESGLPPPVYFKASRRAMTVASLRTEEDVYQAAARVFHGSTQAFFHNRFGVEFGDKSIWNAESHTAKDMLSNAMELILSHAAEERNCYLTYLNQLGLPGEGRSGFFDFVAGGTVQHFYEKLTGSQTSGFYFATSNLPNQFYRSGDIAAPFGNITSFGCSSPLAEHYIMLENVLTDPDTTLVRISKDPVFSDGKNDAWPVMERVQQGIFDYVKDRLRRGEQPAGKEAALGIFQLLFDGSVIAAPQLKKWFVYEDDYDGARAEPCWPDPQE